jgi:hypothetical protein
MEKWEATLPDEQQVRWRALTRDYRNRDIHVEPIVPAIGVVFSSAGWYNAASRTGEPPGAMTHSTVINWLHDPKTGMDFNPVDACGVCLEVAARLLTDYPTFSGFF